jgi:hypothetical protein
MTRDRIAEVQNALADRFHSRQRRFSIANASTKVCELHDVSRDRRMKPRLSRSGALSPIGREDI